MLDQYFQRHVYDMLSYVAGPHYPGMGIPVCRLVIASAAPCDAGRMPRWQTSTARPQHESSRGLAGRRAASVHQQRPVTRGNAPLADEHSQTGSRSTTYIIAAPAAQEAQTSVR